MIRLEESKETEKGLLQTFLFRNKSGCTLRVTNLGARVMGWTVPDREGKLGDIVAGFDRAEDYENDTCYLGAVVGRVANRIRCPLTFDGTVLPLSENEPSVCLHGGENGYESRLFEATIRGQKLELRLHSPDGDQGFPGNLDLLVRYSLSQENELVMEISATCDSDTLCNLTNHTYFCLSDSDYILPTKLRIRSSAITTFDAKAGRGRMIPIANTDFDFSRPKAILRDILSPDPLIRAAGGYDHNYVLDEGEDADAEAYDPASGRVLSLYTDAPAVQFYSGNFLSAQGKGRTYGKYSAFCLEAQGFPYAPNEPSFPSVRLKAGKKYRRKIVYRASVR